MPHTGAPLGLHCVNIFDEVGLLFIKKMSESNKLCLAYHAELGLAVHCENSVAPNPVC